MKIMIYMLSLILFCHTLGSFFGKANGATIFNLDLKQKSETSLPTDEMEEDNSEIPPSTGEMEEDNSEIPPSAGETEEDNSEIPPSAGEAEEDNSEIPSSAGETEGDNSETPSSAGETEGDNSETLPSTGEAEELREPCSVESSPQFDDENLLGGIWIAVDSNFPRSLEFRLRGTLTLAHDYGDGVWDSYNGSYRILSGNVVRRSDPNKEYYPIEVTINYPNADASFDGLISIEEHQPGQKRLTIVFLDDSDENLLQTACEIPNEYFREFKPRLG